MAQSSSVDNTDYYTSPVKEVRKLLQPVDVPPWEAHMPQAARAVDSLITNNYAVIDDFLAPDELAALHKEVAALYTDGRMKDGEIGTNAMGNSGEVRRDMRTDKMVWMEGSETFVQTYLKRHIRRSDIFAQKINILLTSIGDKDSWQGVGRSKIMATCYPGNGARYVAHYDNPNRNGRKLTMILYLTSAWVPADGGVLRMKTNGVQVDVAPLAGRLMCFWSDRRCPHEVLSTESSKNRYAITIWYMTTSERPE